MGVLGGGLVKKTGGWLKPSRGRLRGSCRKRNLKHGRHAVRRVDQGSWQRGGVKNHKSAKILSSLVKTFWVACLGVPFPLTYAYNVVGDAKALGSNCLRLIAYRALNSVFYRSPDTGPPGRRGHGGVAAPVTNPSQLCSRLHPDHGSGEQAQSAHYCVHHLRRVPGLSAPLRTALSLFNDIIVRTAMRYGFNVLDLREWLTETADFSPKSPIEPSDIGGMKIAQGLLSAFQSGVR